MASHHQCQGSQWGEEVEPIGFKSGFWNLIEKGKGFGLGWVWLGFGSPKVVWVHFKVAGLGQGIF